MLSKLTGQITKNQDKRKETEEEEEIEPDMVEAPINDDNFPEFEDEKENIYSISIDPLFQTPPSIPLCRALRPSNLLT